MLLSCAFIQENFLCKGHDRRCRLSIFQLTENMTHVVRRRCRFLCYKSKNVLIFDGNFSICDLNAPAMVVGINADICDGGCRVVLAEEELTRVIGQCDALI